MSGEQGDTSWTDAPRPPGFSQSPRVQLMSQFFSFFSILEIMVEIHDVSVFNDSCVRWHISPESINSKIMYMVSNVSCLPS